MLSLLSKCRFQSVQPVLKISLTIFPISKLDKVEPDTILLTLGQHFREIGFHVDGVPCPLRLKTNGFCGGSGWQIVIFISFGKEMIGKHSGLAEIEE